MTLPDLPDATEPEELASVILDGEATAAEQARAAAPEVAAALARLRAVAEAVGSVGPVDELARERAIAVALDAWGTEAATASATDGAPGDELARRRQARRGLRLVGVAAAVVAALAVGGIALSSGSDDADTSADVAAEAPEGTEAAGSGEDGAESGAGGTATESALALTDLGAFDDLDDLVAFASGEATERTVVEEGDAFADDDSAVVGDATAESGSESGLIEGSSQDAAEPAPATGAAPPSCSPPPPPSGDPVVVSTATLEGRPVTVVVAGTGDDAVVQVVDAQTCELRYEGPAG